MFSKLLQLQHDNFKTGAIKTMHVAVVHRRVHQAECLLRLLQKQAKLCSCKIAPNMGCSQLTICCVHWWQILNPRDQADQGLM